MSQWNRSTSESKMKKKKCNHRVVDITFDAIEDLDGLISNDDQILWPGTCAKCGQRVAEVYKSDGELVNL